jgi:guanosine-3',5'-bis(diphosphate) 3'-pyrophosphohydrolase
VYLFEGLKETISLYLEPEQIELVQEAYIVARDAHLEQTRSSGEPYITHPVAVTQILANMNLDHETLMAALLHDVIEDTPVTREELAEQFGSTVAELVEGVSKLEKIKFSSKEEAQIENYRKMIMAMVQDIRVILIKLADRTHNMRTLGALRPDKRRRIANETLSIYAPLAHRIGIHEIKNELEDLGFKALYPMRYRALSSAVKQARGNRKEIVERIRQEIIQRLDENRIYCDVAGRQKHLYSIYRKMKNKELIFNDVMDIFAFRIVVDSMDTCYRSLGVIHHLYKPIEGRFKDYIAIPRTNGYQSLHTSLVGPLGIPIEVQIRTHEMDEMADKGVAAHWVYKADKEQSGTTAQVKARRWMQSLIELQQSAGSSFEFIENVKTDLFPDEIYVFTPKGQIVELPLGATPIDLAYAVHTDVGNTCVGAKIDRRIASLNTKLDNGQTVEIITATNAKPNANWLNFAITAKARLQVRNYLKQQQGAEALQLGNRLLRHALGSVKLDEIEPEKIEQVLQETQHESRDDLLVDIGLGKLMAVMVAKRLSDEVDDEAVSNALEKEKSGVSIKGAEGLLISYAKCCTPIPGDMIIGQFSPGRGLVVHQQNCSNIRGHESDPTKYLPMQWDDEINSEFTTKLRVELFNHQGSLAKLTTVVTNADSNIINLKTEEKDSSLYMIELEVSVKDRVHLANIMRRIRVIDEVSKVIRFSA